MFTKEFFFTDIAIKNLSTQRLNMKADNIKKVQNSPENIKNI